MKIPLFIRAKTPIFASVSLSKIISKTIIMNIRKTTRLIAVAAFLFVTVFAQAGARETLLLNRNWMYRQGDVQGAEAPDYDDSRWKLVGIPHSFSIPYFMSRDFYTGYGWYRRSLRLSRESLRKCLYLDFEGVFQQAEVFVNGRKAGAHTGGYTGFRIPLSAYLHEGVNIIAVRVNNLWRPDVAPRAGEHTFSGGIYRNVRLVKTDPLHVDWYGTFVTTPDLTKTGGKASAVAVTTDIRNDGEENALFTLETCVEDNTGKRIGKAVRTTAQAAAGQVVTLRQRTGTVERPVLWSPEHPVLYRVISRVYQNNRLVDSYETPFGFRWFEWTADKGFFFNGRHRYLRGANVHQDQAGWGDAATDSAAARDVQMMKDAGFDFIRGSHYPHSPAFTEACDRKGMLFWSEAPFWGIGGFKPDGYWNASAYPVDDKDKAGFETSALQQLREMIRIHRNHPSIIAWSMSNEAFFSDPKVMDGVRSLLKKMVDETHRLDSTRPAAVGGAQRPLGEGRIDRIGDLAGYNGDGATQPDFQRPGVASIVSEYGSITAERPGKYGPGWGDLQKNDTWKGLPWRSGQAIWCGFDHGSIAGSALGKMGIVDYFRIPKRSWYWYRHTYKGIAPPVWPKDEDAALLEIKPSKITGIRADGTDDVRLDITVCSRDGGVVNRSPAVTLKVLSGPGVFPTGKSITFESGSDIRILEGQAAITLRSYYAGKTVVEASSAGLPSSRVSVDFTHAPAYVEGRSQEMPDHPYRRFEAVKKTSDNVQQFGLNNPAFAGSSASGSAPGLAADGNAATFWQPAADDVHPYWILDTEKRLLLKQVIVKFAGESLYRYKIELSDDRRHWRNIDDCSAGSGKSGIQSVNLSDPALKGRFIRLSFKVAEGGEPVRLSEVTVKGIVCE